MNGKEFRDSLLRGRLSRRDVTKLLAAAGLSLVTMPVTRGARAAAEDLIYFTWTGYDTNDFFPSYVQKHGGPPSMPIFADEEEALQKLRAGFQVDLAHPCSGRINRWRDAGVIQPFDTKRLSNWGDVFEPLKEINGANQGGQQWFVPVDWGNTSVLYRTDLFDLQGQPESWGMLWDERYKGRLSIGEDVTDTSVIVGTYIGAADPYAMTDPELAAVKDALIRQKPLIRFYWSDNTAMEQAMASGELVASSAWNSSVVALKNAGVPVAYAKPKGILSWCCGLVMSSNAQQLDLAYDLMDAMISPEAGVWLITQMGYGHSNRKSFEDVDASILADLGLPKDPTALFAESNFSRENKRLETLQAMFEEVKAGL